MSKTESDLKSNDYINSLENIDSNKYLSKQKNRLLYLLEKGKLEHLNSNFSISNKYFEEARQVLESRERNLGSKALALVTNPEAKPYSAEDFEKTTLYYYKALNFFKLGEYDNALVEAKRINIELNRLNDKYKKKKNKYSEDAFSHIIQGVIYEAQNDINNAFIAYRNAAKLYMNDSGYFGISIPNQLKEDLLRTAKVLGFNDELTKYQRLFSIDEIPTIPEKSVIFFWENGLGPYKDQTKITLSNIGSDLGLGSYQNEEYGIVIPIPIGGYTGITSVAIPKYKERGTFYNSAELVSINGYKPLEPVQNYFQIAQQCLKDRIGREIGETILRVATKKAASKGAGVLSDVLGGGWFGKKLTKVGVDAIGAALEKADTRNWQTLPNTIFYTRIPVEKDESSIKLKLYEDSGFSEKEFYLNESRHLEVINFVSFNKVNDDIKNQPELNTKLSGNNFNLSNRTNSIEKDFTRNTIQDNRIVSTNFKSTEKNENLKKRKLLGFGARYSLIEHDDFSYSTIEPEITFYNEDKKIGGSLSYGFLIGEADAGTLDIYFDTFNKYIGNFLVGINNSFGLVLEGQYSTAYYYSEEDFFGFDYEAYGGGLGAFFKGKGSTNVITLGKLILGYNSNEIFSGGLYLTGGLNVLF